MRKKISKLWKMGLNTDPDFVEQSNEAVIELKKHDISTNYDQNLATFKSLFSVPNNIDVKVREFTITPLNRKGFIIYLSTMVNLQIIMESIMEPLLDNEHPAEKIQDIVSYPIATTQKKCWGDYRIYYKWEHCLICRW